MPLNRQPAQVGAAYYQLAQLRGKARGMTDAERVLSYIQRVKLLSVVEKREDLQQLLKRGLMPRTALRRGVGMDAKRIDAAVLELWDSGRIEEIHLAGHTCYRVAKEGAV